MIKMHAQVKPRGVFSLCFFAWKRWEASRRGAVISSRQSSATSQINAGRAWQLAEMASPDVTLWMNGYRCPGSWIRGCGQASAGGVVKAI